VGAQGARSGQPDPEGGEEHEAEVVLRGLVEASGGSPEVLEAAEEASIFLRVRSKGDGMTTVIPFASIAAARAWES
jgi:hypothetical protein